MAKKKTTKKSKPLKKVIKIKSVNKIETEENKERKKKDPYEEHACEYLNESECKEELEEDGLDSDEVEREHFEEDKE